MTDSRDEALREARTLLESGSPQAAFSELQPWLSWPATFESSQDWSARWTIFADIADEITGEELGEPAREVAEQPVNVDALYDLGYELIEAGLPELAATVLARANEISPEQENVVGELVHALEIAGFNAEAADVLRDVPELVERSFMMRYLLAFNSVMAGDIDTARELLPEMVAEGDEESFMYRRIKRFVARHDQITGDETLSENDLRGWHFVTNGSLLLHLSPFGFDDAMRGRYAFVQDSMSTCREGIERLGKVLEVWNIRPRKVWAMPDRDSQILAMATAEVFGLKLETWPEEGTDEPGLIVAYDLAALDPTALEQLYENREGQLLWSHAACWTETPPFSADFQTFLYQHNVTPWGARMSFDAESEEVIRSDPDAREIREIALEIANTSLEADQLEDLPALTGLAITAAHLEADLGPIALTSGSARPVFWECSPVKSNRFQ